MATKQQPLLWGQEDLDSEWFQQPRLEQAMALLKVQELRHKSAVVTSDRPPREVRGSDPDLGDAWFD